MYGLLIYHVTQFCYRFALLRYIGKTFHSSSILLIAIMRPSLIWRGLRPAFGKQPYKEGATFERNFPSGKSPKAWDGKNRDEFFRKKYAHVHARQLKESPRRQEKRPAATRDTIKPEFFIKTQSSRPSKPQLISFYEYVHGASSVLAALLATKRTGVSVLYTSKSHTTADLRIIQAANKRNILIEYDTPKNKMDQITSNAVHNGYALRTRPLVLPRIESLAYNNLEGEEGADESSYGTVEYVFEKPVLVKHQLAQPSIKSNAVGIYIDEVTDPHNVGAILRSAQFLGADFAVISSLNCSKLSPVVSKVSAGALETFPIYLCESPLKFFEASKSQGWNLIAAVPPNVKVTTATWVKTSELSTVNIGAPSLLVVGSEGDGLRKSLLQRCTHVVSITRGTEGLGNSDLEAGGLLDSLNVSVASALLISRLLKD